MTLSPWIGINSLETREAAALLSGLSFSDLGLEIEEGRNDFNLWRSRIVLAAFLDELPSSWAGMEKDDQGRPYKQVISDPWPNNVWAWIEKHELHKWLLSQGIPDDAIPIEIRTYPSKDACHLNEGDELRALEALGLLAETFAGMAPRYQRNGKPNRAQIAEAMSQQAGETPGMSKSKLQRLLSDALDAWEEKRR